MLLFAPKKAMCHFAHNFCISLSHRLTRTILLVHCDLFGNFTGQIRALVKSTFVKSKFELQNSKSPGMESKSKS